MALPQLQSTAEGRQFLDLMKDQKENIVSQTKIMQSISGSIIRQGREATELRKEIANLRKGFVTGKSSNFEDIKKYFAVNKKDAPAEKEKASDKGFFKNALGKIFGPSAYQQKMLDDINKKEAEKQIIEDTLNLYHNPNQKMHWNHHVNSDSDTEKTEKTLQDHYNALTEQIGKLNRQYKNTVEDFSGGRAQRRRRTN
jgi:hypothetical protein